MYATMACLVRHAGHEDGSRMVINRKPRRADRMQDYSETRLHAGVDKRRSETHNLNRLPRDWTTLKLSSPTSEVSYIHYYCLPLAPAYKRLEAPACFIHLRFFPTSLRRTFPIVSGHSCYCLRQSFTIALLSNNASLAHSSRTSAFRLFST